MIALLFASAAPAVADSAINWNVVVAMGMLASLGVSILTLMRAFSGKANERQIEPTQLAAIQAELRAQTVTLSDIKTAGATTATHVGNLQAEVTRLRDDLSDKEDKIFRRVNAISAESTETKTRVEGLEKRESDRRK